MGLFDGDFGDIFSSIGDLFGGGGDAAGAAADSGGQFNVGDYTSTFDPSAAEGGGQGVDAALQSIEGTPISAGGDVPWFMGNDFSNTGGGAGFGGMDPGAISGSAAPIGSASGAPLGSLAAGTGGPTAGALTGPTGPDSTDVGYAPGMGPNGPTTPGNPATVDQAVQYVNGQQGATSGAPPNGDFLDRAWAQVQNNPLAALGVGAGAVGTGLQMLKPPSGNEKALQDLIAESKARGENITDQGNTLLAPLTTGAPLPAGAQAQILQAQRAREAQARSRAAQSGTLNSTMTDSQIAQAREQAVADDFTARQGLARTGTDLLNAGLKEIGGAESGYGTLMKQQIADDQQFQEALASLSASLGRFGGTNQPQQPRYYR